MECACSVPRPQVQPQHQKSNRNTLSILNIKSVLGSYTDLRGPKRATFLYGQDNLQLKSPRLCPWSEHGGGEVGRGSPVTRTDYFKEGYRREGMSWNLVDRADMLSEASSARPQQPHAACACRRQESRGRGSKFPESFQMLLAHSQSESLLSNFRVSLCGI